MIVNILLWCILLVLCWPLALLALVLYPIVWLLLLPFRIVGIAVDGVLDLLRGSDVLYGNLETTIFDARNFSGAPYSWDGDWTNSSVPPVAVQ